jgi:holliday junction DNA helicase RuvA
MIGYLRGKVKYLFGGFLILEVSGVGYEVYCSGLGILEGQEIELFIHTNVKEDEIRLYGFDCKEDLEVFRHLISVGGVGPKSALVIVGTHKAQAIVDYILNSDAQRLCVKGIGKKTAEKIVLELKSKFENSAYRKSQNASIFSSHYEYYADIVEALTSLGYITKEIDSFLKQYDGKKDADIKLVIKDALEFFRSK